MSQPFDPAPQVARSLGLRLADVSAAMALLADSNTVPFIARYRKEATGGLDEVAIADIDAAVNAALALEARRDAILAAIDAQGALTPELARRVRDASDRPTLEDLYLPFKKKRKTRASVARERGLEPLARLMLSQPRGGDAGVEARRYVGAEVPDVAAAQAGARDIAAEIIAEAAPVRALVRDLTARHGRLRSRAVKKKTEGQRTAFEDYYDFAEPLARVPSHRTLAVCRGEAEGYLRVGVDINRERMAGRIGQVVRLRERSPYAEELQAAIEDGYKRLLGPSVDNEVRGDVRARAERDAVDVFAKNLGNLLLSAPYGRRRVVGVDPGFRSGCKCASLTETGRFVSHMTIYPHTRRDGSAQALVDFVRNAGAEAVAVGNGTAGRETLDFVRKSLGAAGLEDVVVVAVNEAGASVYSASETARAEFPDLDLTVRGAISIGRRLQDPLAELVKVEPQSLGVGQYQHDIAPSLLKERLGRVVERCVNRVGVQLDTASAELLAHVSGLGPTTARRIVEYRDAHGALTSRRQLLDVKGLGPRAYEQCAGFLRIRGAANPLDDSAVHPERYGLVRQMARDLGVPVDALVGDAALAGRIDAGRYAEAGPATVADIIQELGKPGLDPRDSFEPPRFRDDVQTMADLKTGMVLEGVVTNVAAFGAFVDIGVHQDGLVHVSQLGTRYVRDPHAVVSVGQRIRVRVVSVDSDRRRISLSVRDVQ